MTVIWSFPRRDEWTLWRAPMCHSDSPYRVRTAKSVRDSSTIEAVAKKEDPVRQERRELKAGKMNKIASAGVRPEARKIGKSRLWPRFVGAAVGLSSLRTFVHDQTTSKQGLFWFPPEGSADYSGSGMICPTRTGGIALKSLTRRRDALGDVICFTGCFAFRRTLMRAGFLLVSGHKRQKAIPTSGCGGRCGSLD